ncbi:hypothetical protein ACHAXA_011608 [Cyclostephanos tholiformis]|uniref:Glutathione synthetase n=1 Tax=Cyclostephanos tholiformis TaxID=382380 RepID=A0ABD3RV58_9STRA
MINNARSANVEIKGNANGGGYICAPISLLPQSYPKYAFDGAVMLSGPFGLLVDRVSRDGDFLRGALCEARGVDEYTNKLLLLYEGIYLDERTYDDAGGGGGVGRAWGEHARSADRLGILRSDYMLHERSMESGGGGGGVTVDLDDELRRRRYSLKQVELNTIASSFAGLASKVANMHSFLTRRMEGNNEGGGGGMGEVANFLNENDRAVGGKGGDGGTMDGRGVPANPAMTRLPMAMAVAYNRYVARYLRPSSDDGGDDDGDGGDDGGDAPISSTSRPIVLFVVQPGETNTVDQRMLEFALWENHGIPVVRISLAEAYDRAVLDESTGRLALIESYDNDDDDFISTTASGGEVAIVYYRAGYAPTDYPSGMHGIEWLARERLERSRATKCPNLGYHLAGTKKVQQELARPGAVERFFPDDATTARLLRSAFAGLYGLGADADVDDLRAVGEVLLRGMEGRYVLKPQREGGGYNFYGADMARKLGENCDVSSDGSVALGPALSEFILMERLFPPQQRAILLRNGRVEGTGMTISELGCFGTIVASGDGDVVHNEYAGFLLRTKFSGVDEGGVASGFATLSSPYLC